jgi:hypothetical protein
MREVHSFIFGHSIMRSLIYSLAAIIALHVAPTHAHEVTALAIEGWTASEGKNDVVYYRCASAICAEGSVVSYKQQPHHPVTLEEFERHHRRLADENKGSGQVRDAVVTAAQEREVDGVKVLQVKRAVDWSDGKTTHTIEARLIGPERSYSLVSDSPQADWTANNFEGFLRPLVAMAGLKGGGHQATGTRQ